MQYLSHFEDQRRKNWCVLVVMVAIFSLTLSLATRYSTPCSAPIHTVKTVKAHTYPEAKRQRLAKDAAIWLPTVICFDALRPRSFYPRVAPAGPPLPTLIPEENLYNRPPPSILSIS